MNNDSTRHTDEQQDKPLELTPGDPAGGKEGKDTLGRRLRREPVPFIARVLVQLLLWWITKDPHHFPGGH